ncbi:MAG TPA: RCC1 domain-containing protein, partial [Candidatus Limnocylindria bacterium]|nr:RCC1 domain-containing protein [Candidatus Limnocylindria bacterium]
GTEGGWKAVAGGEYHSVALREDGTLWAWGRATDGQLGHFAAKPVLGGAVWGNPQP